jgi:hypothetical protein
MNRFQGIDSAILYKSGRRENHIWRAGSPGHKGWRNRFLGSLNVYKFELWVYSGIPTKPCLGSFKHSFGGVRVYAR